MQQVIRTAVIMAAMCALLLAGTCVSMAAEQEPMKIGTYDQLKTFIDGVNNGTIDAHQDAVLTSDIVVPENVGNDWIPLGADADHAYQGTFSGEIKGSKVRTYTISGIKIERNDPAVYQYPDPWDGAAEVHDYTAFISFLGKEGVVKNLTVKAEISDVSYAAGIVSQNWGTIENCCFQGTLRSEIYPHGAYFDDYNGSAGCIAAVNAGSILCCSTEEGSALIRGGVNAAGIAGAQINGGVIDTCVNSASVTLRDTIYKVEGVYVGGAGGIVGTQEVIDLGDQESLPQPVGIFLRSEAGQAPKEAAGTDQPLVENCYNEGAISAPQLVGGICGFSGAGIIRDSGGAGNIEDVESGRAGGIAGYIASEKGLPAEIINCANKGSINANTDPDKRGDYIGGIAGWALDYIPNGRRAEHTPVKISNCKNTGNVYGRALVGGVLGKLENGLYDVEGRQETCVYQLVNLGQVNGENLTGGIAGSCPGVIADTINYGGVNAVLGEDSKKNGCLIGGITGATGDSGWITSSYNMGPVSVGALEKARYWAGGIAGSSAASLDGCYFCMDTSGDVKSADGTDTTDPKGLLPIQEMTGDAAAAAMGDLMDPQSGAHYGTVWSCREDVTRGGVTYAMTPQFETTDLARFDLDDINLEEVDLTKKDWVPLDNAVVTPEKDSYVYTGGEITPSVQVSLDGTVLAPNRDYVVYGAYDNVQGGEATVLVLGRNGYCGTASATFEIVPAKAGLKSVKAGKKSITVTMKKAAAQYGGKKFQVQYRVKGTSKWKTVTTVKKSVKIRKGLKKGKKYQVRTRAVAVSAGKEIYGKWSRMKTSGKVK